LEAFGKEDDSCLAEKPHPGDRFVDPRFGLGLSEAADLFSCVADKSLSPSQMAERVFLEKCVDKVVKALRQKAGLREKILGCHLPIGFCLRWQMMRV